MACDNKDDSECGICGEPHSITFCTTIQITNHIPDTVVPPRAYLTLPSALKIETMSDGHQTVVVKYTIRKGTKFGPLQARKLFTLDPSIVFPLKIFCEEEEDMSEYYLDTSDENECSWMMFVEAAVTLDEQNLVCYQEKQNIYYVTLKDINEGEQLKVWYSKNYAKKIRKPLLECQNLLEEDLQEKASYISNKIDLTELVKQQQKIISRETWTCKFCATVEVDVVKFSNHILDHYLLQLRKVCEICREAFNTRKGLKKHISIIHQKPKPQNPTLPSTPPSPIPHSGGPGGPLLNILSNDSLDNSNMLLQHTEYDPTSHAALLETENLNVDNLLNENVKGLDHFNFEIDECHDQFVCDVCLKPFGKLPLLVMHMRLHTGQYTCLSCYKIFARKESLRCHSCSDKKPGNIRCDLCQKTFPQHKYLNRHVLSVHKKKFRCHVCNRVYRSNQERKDHNCSGIRDSEKETFKCRICDKNFFRELYLKKHMKAVHLGRRAEKDNGETLICEVCATPFANKQGLRKHMMSHGDLNFMCQICDKKFSRRDVLDNHILTHADMQFKCDHCEKTYRHKRNRHMHMLEAHKDISYTCPECPKTFTRRANLNKHQSVHRKTCGVCNLEFATVEQRHKHSVVHLNASFKCDSCEKSFKLRSSLTRHARKHHPEEKREGVEEEVGGGVVEGGDGVVGYGENFDSRDFGSLSFGEDVRNCGKEVKAGGDESILDFNDLEMDLNGSFGVQEDVGDKEVCLSMPDLMEGDQEITFGRNAYILDNGNVVEPQDEGNVIVYVLDQKFQTD